MRGRQGLDISQNNRGTMRRPMQNFSRGASGGPTAGNGEHKTGDNKVRQNIGGGWSVRNTPYSIGRQHRPGNPGATDRRRHPKPMNGDTHLAPHRAIDPPYHRVETDGDYFENSTQGDTGECCSCCSCIYL